MRPESQRQEIALNKHDDRISKLPDVIIGEILSLIPTIEAVATSILSKRWLYLWTLLKNLDFHYWDESGDKKDQNAFVNYVDGVFSKCTTQELNKFKLDGDWGGETHITRWIDEAISRNVQILEVDVPELPSSVFTSKSLTLLKAHVDLDTVLNIPNSCHLPKLKGLRISFSSPSIESVQKLVSGCPAMEYLFMSAEIGSQQTFVISLPLLNKLELHTVNHSFGESEYTLVIDAPKLQSLEMASLVNTNGDVPSYEIKNVASEVEATINIGDWKTEVTEKEIHCILGLLNQLIEVKSLTLCTRTMRGLGNAVPKMLPIFNKLTLLELRMYSSYGWEIVPDLLQASPNLEVFNVYMMGELEEEDREIHWIEPQHVPVCLSSCLRVIKIEWKFKEDYEHGLEMMKYLLGNGEVLEKFIFSWNRSKEVGFCEKLLSFPRASRYCEVEVM